MARHLRMGLDVGGTNVDVAMLHGSEVIGGAKVPTSANLLQAIAHAAEQALQVAKASALPFLIRRLSTQAP